MQKTKVPNSYYKDLVVQGGSGFLEALHDLYIKSKLNCMSAYFGAIYKIYTLNS